MRPLPLDRVGVLRDHHRLALPVLAPAFSRLHVDAAVTVCSSSGWAHGAKVGGRKVVYCHTPARWLYQRDRYLAGASAGLASWPCRSWLPPSGAGTGGRRPPPTATWSSPGRCATGCGDLYGIDAELLPPPVDLDTDGPTEPVDGIEPGLLPVRLEAAPLQERRGGGGRLRAAPRPAPGGGGVRAAVGRQSRRRRPPNVVVAGRVSDAALRWLYRSSAGLVAASYEDFGLTPVEAAAFGRPTAALRFGGFLDTTVEGETGVFFDRPGAGAIAGGVERLAATDWDPDRLRDHARRYSAERFTARLREVVDEERRAS